MFNVDHWVFFFIWHTCNLQKPGGLGRQFNIFSEIPRESIWISFLGQKSLHPSIIHCSLFTVHRLKCYLWETIHESQVKSNFPLNKSRSTTALFFWQFINFYQLFISFYKKSRHFLKLENVCLFCITCFLEQHLF